MEKIKTKKDLQYYLQQDALAQKYTTNENDKPRSFGHLTWKCLVLLRKYEFFLNNNKKIRTYLMKRRFNKLCLRLGFYLCPNTIGPGARLPHYGYLSISGNAKIGSNCVIHQGTTIGESYGDNNGCPIIGDNVVIGANCVLIGNITIANNICIGAGSIVTKSLLEPNSTYVGNPAKKISSKIPNIIDNRLK